MAQGEVRLALEPEREPAGQPFGVNELLALRLTVPAGQLEGEVEVAGAQRGPDLQLALEPPEGGMDQAVGRIEQQLDHGVVQMVLPAPAQAIEHQPGIVLQRRRHRLDRAVDPGLAPLQTQTRGREFAIAVGHALEHPARRPAPVVPQQVVQAVDLILRGQQAPIFAVKPRLLGGREVALDPGAADQRLGRLVLVDPEQRLGVADHAPRGQRRPVLEEAAGSARGRPDR